MIFCFNIDINISSFLIFPNQNPSRYYSFTWFSCVFNLSENFYSILYSSSKGLLWWCGYLDCGLFSFPVIYWKNLALIHTGVWSFICLSSFRKYFINFLTTGFFLLFTAFLIIFCLSLSTHSFWRFLSDN